MLYQVDEQRETLTLLPMAARRALDWAGLRLPLAGWQSLPFEARQDLVRLGAADLVDTRAVATRVQSAQPPAEPMSVRGDPAADAIPRAVAELFGPDRPIPLGTWASLGALDRYVLGKVCERPRPERLALAYAQIIGESGLSPHVNPSGGVRMVGVGHKPETARRALAEAYVAMAAETFARLMGGQVGKGDVLGTARIAGIQGAKRASDWIPLCHPLRLTKIDVSFEPEPELQRLRVVAEVHAFDRTGVEMEALTAVSAAALTIYDMLKAYDRGIQIGPIRLAEKSGGRSGDWLRESV